MLFSRQFSLALSAHGKRWLAHLGGTGFLPSLESQKSDRLSSPPESFSLACHEDLKLIFIFKLPDYWVSPERKGHARINTHPPHPPQPEVGTLLLHMAYPSERHNARHKPINALLTNRLHTQLTSRGAVARFTFTA